MHYLHFDVPEAIIHGDLKSSNGKHCSIHCAPIGKHSFIAVFVYSNVLKVRVTFTYCQFTWNMLQIGDFGSSKFQGVQKSSVTSITFGWKAPEVC